MNLSLDCRLIAEYTNRCGPLMYPNSSYHHNYLLTTLYIHSGLSYFKMKKYLIDGLLH